MVTAKRLHHADVRVHYTGTVGVLVGVVQM